jgi:osmotically-inducible protein OsmY
MTTVTLLRPPATSTDEDLVRNIGRAIRTCRNGLFFPISVHADEGIVTLCGRVRSFYEKQLLLHTVQRVQGVVSIEDEVEVLPPL